MYGPPPLLPTPGAVISLGLGGLVYDQVYGIVSVNMVTRHLWGLTCNIQISLDYGNS